MGWASIKINDSLGSLVIPRDASHTSAGMHFEVFGLIDIWRFLIIFQGSTIRILSSLYEINYSIEVSSTNPGVRFPESNSGATPY